MLPFPRERDMKLLVIAALVSGLAGCSPAPSEAPTAASAPATEHTPATTVLQAPSGFPEDCQTYLDRVQSCAVRQRGAIANAVRAGAEQTQASWAGLPRAERAEACETSLAAFAVQAPALGC